MTTSEMPDVVVAVPARMDSQRLPGKPLLKALGKTLLEWTVDEADQVKKSIGTVVLGCDDELESFCKSKSIWYQPTPSDCRNGTHRIAHFAVNQKWLPVGTVVNWQVDEPCIDPLYVRRMVIYSQETGKIVTLVSPHGNMEDPNQVKVIVNGARCIWFSRAPMAGSLFHTGVYAFPIEVLRELASINAGRYEKAESLEQLGWIESHREILAIRMSDSPLSINTPDDWTRFKEMKCNQLKSFLTATHPNYPNMLEL